MRLLRSILRTFDLLLTLFAGASALTLTVGAPWLIAAVAETAAQSVPGEQTAPVVLLAILATALLLGMTIVLAAVAFAFGIVSHRRR